MGVSPVNASASTQNTAQTSSTSGSSDDLSMNDFFQLLSAQLEYQDPMQPTDNTEFMAQMAQFSLLEQVENLSKTISLSTATTAVGKSAVYNVTDSAGNTTQDSGQVAAVDLTQDSPQYLINGGWVAQSAITDFYDPTQLPNG